MTKTIGVVSVIALAEPGSGLLGTEAAQVVATDKLNKIYHELQTTTKDLEVACRLLNVSHVTHDNFYRNGDRRAIVEAVGVFESELYSTHAELEAIRSNLGYRSLGQYIRDVM